MCERPLPETGRLSEGMSKEQSSAKGMHYDDDEILEIIAP
jgi:hypothetical protein